MTCKAMIRTAYDNATGNSTWWCPGCGRKFRHRPNETPHIEIICKGDVHAQHGGGEAMEQLAPGGLTLNMESYRYEHDPD